MNYVCLNDILFIKITYNFFKLIFSLAFINILQNKILLYYTNIYFISVLFILCKKYIMFQNYD